MTVAKVKRAKEFGLSTEVPEAVQEMELKRANDAWQARSDAAADAIAMPAAPFRIRGDSEAGAWFVEEAEIKRSRKPEDSYWVSMPAYTIMIDDAGHPRVRMGHRDHSKLIAELDADQPTAALKWERIGRTNRGFRTYAKALKWLREELEPIRDESTYFRPDGQQAA